MSDWIDLFLFGGKLFVRTGFLGFLWRLRNVSFPKEREIKVSNRSFVTVRALRRICVKTCPCENGGHEHTNIIRYKAAYFLLV